MRVVGLALALCTVAGAAGGWHSLFDGKTTFGWVEVTGKPFPENCWRVEDGCLKALVRTDGFQDIRTVETFTSFELEFDWKLGKDGNSGVKYLIQRVDEWTNKAGREARARGLEYQLADDANSDAASDPRRVAGSLYSVIAPVPKLPPKIGAFNHSRIVVRGTHVEHWLNGVRVVEFDTQDAAVRKHLGELAKGGPIRTESAISLQNHSSEAWFKNLRVRRLE